MGAAVWSTIIAIIALAVSVLSPVITTLVNNHHQRKSREWEFYEEHKAHAIENYLRCAGAVLESGRGDASEYGKSMGEILLYVSDSLRDKIVELDTCFKATETRLASTPIFAHICEELSQESPRIQYYRRKKDVKKRKERVGSG